MDKKNRQKYELQKGYNSLITCEQMSIGITNALQVDRDLCSHLGTSTSYGEAR